MKTPLLGYTMIPTNRLLKTRPRWLSTLALTTVLLIMSGCQNVPTYKAYSGPAKPTAEVANVFIPEEFNLLNVDGNSYTQPLLGLGTNVKLLPGSHKIVIKYVYFWTVDSENQEKVKSQPMQLSFDAQAGEKYQLVFPKLADLRAAQAFVDNPKVDIINTRTKNSVANNIRYQLKDKGLLAAFLDSQASTDTPASPADNTSESPADKSKSATALERLKYWWQKANTQQQEDFMKWMVEK